MKLILWIFGFVALPSITTSIKIETSDLKKHNTISEEGVDDDFLDNLMKPKNIAYIFGPEALVSAPVYDPEKEEYVRSTNTVERDISFILYTSNTSFNGNGSTGVIIVANNPLILEQSGFITNATTKIICHGFMSDYLRGPGKYLVPAYLEKSAKELIPINIILVNWAKLAGIHKTEPPPPSHTRKWYDVFYLPPASNTELVGNKTAKIIKFVVDQGVAKLEDIHLIGHSLGAHAMGYAGRSVYSTLQAKVSRITALDPAGPCFETFSHLCTRGNFRNVNKSDAEFVDVIHTHARCLGMKNPVGHADFYPNGGYHQPECHWRTFGLCSHRRAIVLMAQSVKASTKDLLAHKCPNWELFAQGSCNAADFAMLGEECSPKADGVYFLSTHNQTRLELAQNKRVPEN